MIYTQKAVGLPIGLQPQHCHCVVYRNFHFGHDFDSHRDLEDRDSHEELELWWGAFDWDWSVVESEELPCSQIDLDVQSV